MWKYIYNIFISLFLQIVLTLRVLRATGIEIAHQVEALPAALFLTSTYFCLSLEGDLKMQESLQEFKLYIKKLNSPLASLTKLNIW